jgi:hypothetical protein
MRILLGGDYTAPVRGYRPRTVKALGSKTLLVDALLAAAVLAFSLGAIAHGGFDSSDQGLDASSFS